MHAYHYWFATDEEENDNANTGREQKYDKDNREGLRSSFVIKDAARIKGQTANSRRVEEKAPEEAYQ